MVSFYLNGIETPVIVDDHFPVRYGKPAFASTRDGELWVMLLEKAWAKLQGSFARTIGGLTSRGWWNEPSTWGVTFSASF